MNTVNSKTSELDKFVLSLSQKVDLRSSDKHVALQNLSIYCTWKNRKNRKPYKKNKLKIVAPTWNDEFELPDGSYSVSDIQEYIEFIIEKHETLTTIPPIHVYSNRINNKLVFKIKDGYKLELQAPEAMKLFDSRKRINRQKKKKNRRRRTKF